MKKRYEVLIVGAGPAGAVLGYELAQRGVEVLILEKEALPRYKCCAGVVSDKSARLLGCDLSEVTHCVIEGARITYKLKKEFVKRYEDRPIGYMVMRSEFDEFLTRRAERAGVQVAENRRVERVTEGAEEVEVSAGGESYAGLIVVGADGATSAVAKATGLRGKRQLGVALESELRVSERDLEKWEALAGLDLGIVRGGYGWVFPKRQLLSVGVGAPLARGKTLPAHHKALLSWLQLETSETLHYKGHLLPTYLPGTPLHTQRTLLLGDAAGMVDPMSGEGIHNAMKSALLAAPVLADQVRSPQPDLTAFQRAVDEVMLPELQIARQAHWLFTWAPRLSFLLLLRTRFAWRAGAGVGSGKLTYGDLRNALGPLRFLIRV